MHPSPHSISQPIAQSKTHVGSEVEEKTMDFLLSKLIIFFMAVQRSRKNGVFLLSKLIFLFIGGSDFFFGGGGISSGPDTQKYLSQSFDLSQISQISDLSQSRG